MLTPLPLRTNPAAWLSPIVTIGIVYMWLTVESPIVPDPYWTAYLARAGDGLQYGLPVGAAGAAWSSWRQRRIAESAPGSLRGAARIYWTHLWPVFAAVALGVGICVLAEAAKQPPYAALPNLGLIIVFIAMTGVATGIGWMTGKLLPLAIALPVALFVAFEWAVYALADGGNVSYRNIAGYALFGCCDSASYEPAPRAVVAPVLMMLGVLAAVFFAIRWRGRLRWLLPGAPALAAGVVIANVVAVGTGPYGERIRDATAEHCVGRDPVVCIFPEVGSYRERALMQHTIRTAHANAAANGLALPTRVMMSGRYPVNRTGVTFVALASGFTRQQIILAYADGVHSSLQCTPEVSPDPRVPPGTEIGFALAAGLGLDIDAATPQLAIGGAEGSGTGRELSPAEIRSMLGVQDQHDAIDIARTWLQQQYACATEVGAR